MLKQIKYIAAITWWLFCVVANANGNEASEFEKMITKGAIRVVNVSATSVTKEMLSKHGYNECKNNKFCVVWYFNNHKKALYGVKKAKEGNLFDPISGMIAIYSKNKKLNEIICYEPRGGC